MLLNEILNKKIDYEVIKERSDMFVCEAKIGGRTIIVECSKSDHYADEVWDVAFGEKTKTNSLGITFGKTGSGSELEVFALVKDCLLEFVARYNPEMITFTADKDSGTDKMSRANLYERLLKRFKLPKYEYKREEQGDSSEIFTLVRK